MKLFTGLLATIFLAGSWVGQARAADCPVCKAELDDLTQHLGLKTNNQRSLEANRKYLEKLSPDDASKRIKVNSNILIATINLETIENRILNFTCLISQKGCQSCLPPGMTCHP